MKKNLIIRLLGLTLSVVIATSNMTSVVYAAEPTNVVVEDVVEPTTDTLDPEEAAEEEPPEEEQSEDEVVLPIQTFGSNEEVNAYLEANPSNGKRLVLFTDVAPEDYMGATQVATHEGLWMLTYEDADKCAAACNAFVSAGYVADIDTSVDYHEGEELTEELTPNDVPVESVEEQAVQTTDVIEEEKLSVERNVVVAVIDTGVDTQDELLQNRLIEGLSEDMADANGHGTTMAEIIASQTGENVKIMPIAAFDESGTSTVAKVYFAIENAIAANVDVINISASGLGESKVLTKAITDAKNVGIPVIVAAGNDASDSKNYMPGNVLDAITISATDKEKNFAEYSNYGETVDFSAIGILVKDMGTEDESDDVVLVGTSIASAYVSAYAALLISEYEDDVTDVDVFESFLASVEDLGEEGFDPYYGNGFLNKDSIVAVIKEKREAGELSDEDISDELEEEGDQELKTAYKLDVGYEWNQTCYALVGQTTVNGFNFNGHIHIGSNTSSNGMAEAFCNRCGYNPSGPWHQGTAVLSRNPGDKVVFNNCTFTNCWTEFFFDAEFNNCTFYNCNFSNNGSGNIVRFNYCNINPSGFSGLVNTQAQSHKAHATYAGILGGLCTRWELNGTTLNGTGAACAVSNCFQGSASSLGYPAYIKLMNGSHVYGGNVCAVDAWLSQAPNVEVYVDSSSRIDSSPVGIYNQGRTYVNNGTITACSDTGIANYQSATVSGGTITGNGVGIRNWGSLAVNGGAIRDNASWGIINSGNTNIVSNGIVGNRTGGVYQNGTLYMSGNGVVDAGNQIYLTPGHVVTVNAPLNNAKVGTLNMGIGDRKTGRQLIQLYAADTSVGETVASKFVLAFDRNDNIHTMDCYEEDGTKIAAKGEQVESLIRAGYGTDQNAPTNQVILSGVYYAGFESNIEGLDGMKITIPLTYNKLRYGEKYLPDTPSHAYTTGESNDPTVVVTMPNGEELDITKSLSFKGWALDSEETDESKIYTTDQVMAMYGDFHWYAIWDACFDLYFDGNAQTRGENYQLNEFHMDTPLPGNVGPEGTAKNYFGKEDVYKASEKTWYDENKEQYVDMTVPYSYQGWSLRDDAVYTDADVVNPEKEEKDTLGEALGVGSYNAGVKWLIEKIKNGETMGFDEEGRAIVPIYVAWDQAPVIEAYDLYVSKDEVESLGEEPFWENVTARDKEDGTLENKVDVTIVNFDKSELDEIEGDRGGVSVTYRAEDGAGNVTFYTVIVNVISNTAMTSWTPNADGSKRDTANYVRFIDRENYNKHVTADGGMEEHSVWYTKPEYVDLITTAFDHIDNKTSVISYELDLPTMQAIQQYNHDHFGEVLETSYRTNFYEQFLAPNVVSGSL
ncbi:Subtilase family protein [Lachnospiraceae bacterium XBD2001]|nr:Subtilase family protein [Lachnospiraceae bacterium XBD2001]